MQTDSKEIINADAFAHTLKVLRAGGKTSTDEEASVRKEYGSRVADDMAHGPIKDIGHALVELIGTLPGSNLSTEAKSRQHNAGTLVSSYRAVDAELEKKDEGMIEATADEINTDVISLKIKRSGEDHTSCKVSLKITDKGELKEGWLSFNNLAETDGSVQFGPDGSILKVGDRDPGVLTQLAGKKLSLPQVISAVTSGGGLGEKGNIKTVLDSILAQAS